MTVADAGADDRPRKLKKAEYAERIKAQKERIDAMMASVRTIEKETLRNDELSGYGRLSIANTYLNMIAMYCAMSDLSLSLLGVKNEGFLNDARKLLYKVIATLQEIVSNHIDEPFSENEPRLAKIAKLDDRKRLNLCRKLVEALKAVEERFGPNSKWRWSFVDLAAEVAVTVKNLTDFRRIQTERDPRSEGFQERAALLRLVKEELRTAAARYREKYEMVTHEPSEMKKAILLLETLHRIHVLFGEAAEAETVRKNIAIWEEKIESDMRKMDEERKRKGKAP